MRSSEGRGGQEPPGPFLGGTASRRSRFEWRTWGDLGAARQLLCRAGEDAFADVHHDVYLPAQDAALSVKVRGDRVELKRMTGVRQGFEVWQRAGSHRLPCSAAFAEALVRLLTDYPAPDRVARHAGGGRRVELDDVLGMVAAAGVSPIWVTKRRERYRVGGQRAEITSVTIDEARCTLHCVVLEGSDLAELVRMRRALGIEQGRNVSVHRAVSEASQGRDPG